MKRMINITAIYFYKLIRIERLKTLYYPDNISKNCGGVPVPQQHIKDGVNNADLGILVANEQNNTKAPYIAKSTSCAFLKSNNRPIWGIIIWNQLNLKYDQEGFQQILFVAAHEMTHILGFSAFLYELYPTGWPLLSDDTGNYVNTTLVMK